LVVRIAFGSDDHTPFVDGLIRFLQSEGHEVTRFGKAAGEDEPWGPTAVRVGRAVSAGSHDFGIVCCWTGTGVSIAANKVSGVRAALCVDAETARGARKWNDANVLALSLRLTSDEVAKEIARAWLAEGYGGTEDPSLVAIADAERTGEAPRLG
jgi:ribose 5-phosphate isomerase B